VRQDEQIAKVREVAEPVLSGLGYDLIAIESVVEHGRKIVRFYIDRFDQTRGAVGIEDCVNATKELSPVFDVADVIDGRWELEISSPGINRPLARKTDFEKFAGQKVAVRTYEKVGDRRNFLGVLLGIDGEEIRINVDGREHRVPLSEVQKAHLDVL
jgi:ribosome maturation factor RimP